MKEFIVIGLIFWGGALVGFIIRAMLGHFPSHYTGTILVSENEKKIVYSLVLDDYPERIAFEKEVIFKVDASAVENLEELESQLKQGL